MLCSPFFQPGFSLYFNTQENIFQPNISLTPYFTGLKRLTTATPVKIITTSDVSVEANGTFPKHAVIIKCVIALTINGNAMMTESSSLSRLTRLAIPQRKMTHHVTFANADNISSLPFRINWSG